VRNVGDVDAAFAKADKIVEAEYYTPHLAHVSMEPNVAVAEYRDGKVLAWAPTQNPQAVQDTIASVLGIKKEDVTCHVTLLGGGFGRKSKPDQVAEAAVLSKQLGKPVKVVTWTREDDIKFDFFHSVAAMYMKAAIGPDGKPTAWLQRTVIRRLVRPLMLRPGMPTTRWAWAGTICRSIFRIIGRRTGLPTITSALDGCAAWRTSITPSRFIPLPTNWRKAANRDSVEYLLDLIGPSRMVQLDLKGDEAEDAKTYPWIPHDCGV
jgi:isoquinoline 1-oxidoreductase subunit beta